MPRNVFLFVCLFLNVPSRILSRNEELKQKWGQQFDDFDASGDGKLNIKELKKQLKRMGADVSDEDVAEMFSGVDTDGNKMVTRQEFINEMWKRDRKAYTKEFFEKYDTDGSGKLTADELRKFGELDDPDDVEKMIEKIDKNADDKISYDEYLKWLDS